MARGVNRVTLVGNLGNDPEVKYTQGGTCITTISLATTSVRKDKDGNQVEKAQWHRVKLIGKLGEIAGEYLKKGRQVYIEGSLDYGSYEKDGVKHYTTDIIADEMQMIGGGGEGGERGTSAQASQSGGQRAGGYGNRQPAQRREPAQSAGANPGNDNAPIDDDYPF